MKQEEIQNQIKKLEKEYADLKLALATLTSNFSNTSILRGILSGAGSAAELILKCVYRKEITLDEKIPAERAEEMKRQASEKLMLDELIKNVESKIPLRILTHLRTIQAWRNIGSHDKGEEINETVNSSSLQVVSLAVNELIIWFVSEYLNLDATNFVDNSAKENTTIRNTNADSIEAWKEAYWYAMKDGSISRLDQSKLDFLSKKLNLTEEDKNKVIASFERNETEFVELISEIFKNKSANNLDLDELEHVDFIRQECCISEKEASELLQQKTFNNKIIKNKDKITFEWIRNLIPDADQTIVVNETKHEVVKPEIKFNIPENKIQEESTLLKYIEIEGIKMVFVEGGEFIMGDNGIFDATPPHKVELDSFYIGKYSITQEQWKNIMGDNPSTSSRGSDKPVTDVSWYDCQEFIKKLNFKTSKNFRLPTEAEWEYAARGGIQSKGFKFSGSNNIDEVAWYNGNSTEAQPVGLKKPNELGIYDMSGNVWEWCADWYDENYYRKSIYENPQGPRSGDLRVFRGGSWRLNPDLCLAALRNNRNPVGRFDSVGFRLLSPVE